MITNNQIKLIKSLHQSKFRQKYNNFIAEGEKIAEEILQYSTYNIKGIYATEKWCQKHEHSAAKFNHILTQISLVEMGKISALKTPSNVLLVLDRQSETINYKLMNESHALYLDGVQDPGNVGTIIRIADWFGIRTVIRNSRCADFYNPKVIQATMASFLNVNMYTEEFENMVDSNHESIGAVMNGSDLESFQWPKQSLLVLGNEGKGIRAAIHHKLDHQVSIPGSDSRVADSLNVSIAAGILCSRL